MDLTSKRMGHQNIVHNPFTPVPMTGYHRVTPNLTVSSSIMKPITSETEKQALVDIQIENVAKLLGGVVERVTGVDHTGRTYDKIVIIYNDTKNNE